MSALSRRTLHGAAAALLALSGCSSAYYAESYHATSQFPPTPSAEQAYAACRGEIFNQFAGELTALYAVSGPLGAMVSDVGDRHRAATAACMSAHGYVKDS